MDQHCSHCAGLHAKLDSQDAEITSLWTNVTQLHGKVRTVEKVVETRITTRLWKQIWFLIDGWPWHKIVDKPRWRPWRRWYTS